MTVSLKWGGPAVLLILVLCLNSCASLTQVVQEPRVSVQDVRTTALSFSEISLELNLLVENPNPVGIQLAGYDYDLLLHDASFIRGNLDSGVSLPAGGSTILHVPVTLDYRELYSVMNSLADECESDYKIVAGLQFDLPVVGKKRIELVHKGVLPLVKLPRFRFTNLYVENLGMMGADLIVMMTLENPNGFDISMDDFQGSLSINKLKWAELESLSPIGFAPGETGDLGFQFRLDFLSMGRTVRDLLSGDEILSYTFEGGALIDTSLDLLRDVSLPLSLSGSVELLKPGDTTQGKHSSVKIEQTIEDNLINIFGIKH